MSWIDPPNSIALNPTEVHIWRAGLDVAPDVLAELERSLSTDEHARAARFKFDQHRQRFIAGRGMLRSLLSRYLGCRAIDLAFTYGHRGRPSLENGALQFNLAHSEDSVLYAIAPVAVGVDLEVMRSMDNLEALARRFFAPSEHQLIRSVSEDEQHKLFFRYWTCKEAFLKATGDGLGKLEGLEIDLSLTRSAQLKTLPIESQNQAWCLQELDLEQENVCAAIVVAAEKSAIELKQFVL